MASPLLAGKTEVTKTETTTAPRKRYKTVSKASVRGYRSANENVPTSANDNAENYSTKSPSSLTLKQQQRYGRVRRTYNKTKWIMPKKKGPKTLRAGIAAIFVAMWTLPFWGFQLALWFLGIAALGVEDTAIIGWFLPGTEVYMLAQWGIVVIGVPSILFALIMFIIRLVDWHSGLKPVVLFVCAAGYFAPIINIVPWAVVWALAVVYMQHEESKQ